MTKKRSTRRKSSRRKKRQPSLLSRLTLDQWLDILGYGLLAVAALTILSFLSANHGLIPGWWLGLLRRAFGWGAYLTPLFVGAVGLWLLLRNFGDRLPQVTLLQLTGIVLGYLALLTTSHFAAALALLEGDLREMLAAAADAGLGGGHLGELLARPLLDGLGNVGAAVALVTWWLIVVALTFGVTVQDSARTLQRLWGTRQPRRKSLPTPKTTTRPAPPAPGQPAAHREPVPINGGPLTSSRLARPTRCPCPITAHWRRSDVATPHTGRDSRTWR